MHTFLLSLVLILFSPPTTEPLCLSSNEGELARLVNEYRQKEGLDEVKLSTALSLVAQAHVKDLVLNSPYQENGKCNPHSWSEEGDWKACCYSDGSKDGPCMWDKPREMTAYTGDGYEIVMYSFTSDDPTREVSATDALKAWQESKKHDAVILNKDMWAKVKWEAMGVGIYEGFAAIWFGRETDPSVAPEICN